MKPTEDQSNQKLKKQNSLNHRELQDDHELTEKVVHKLKESQVIELIKTVDMDEN